GSRRALGAACYGDFRRLRAGRGRGRDGPSPLCSGRPPHGSQRAELPHWALATGRGVEAVVGPRVEDLGRGEPPFGQGLQTFPVGSIALASSAKGMKPV